MWNHIIGIAFISGAMFFASIKTIFKVLLELVWFGSVIYNVIKWYFDSIRRKRWNEDISGSEISEDNPEIDATKTLKKSQKEYLNWDEYCHVCSYYNSALGVCSKIHENVRSYPEKFGEECNGEFFSSEKS